MGYDYSKPAATALRLLTKFGAAATIKQLSSDGYNPATGTASVLTASQACFAAVFDIEQKMVDGTNVLAGDKTAYVSASGVTEPKEGSVLTWQGKDYRIVKHKTLAPAGVAVLFELQVRP
jgi:hypothetical protein